MIETLSLIEPLIGEVAVTILDESRIDGEDVLLAPDSLNILLGLSEGILVVLVDSEREPSLADLWVRVQSHIQVLVNFRHGLVGN